jgi:hypothetical protein
MLNSHSRATSFHVRAHYQLRVESKHHLKYYQHWRPYWPMIMSSIMQNPHMQLLRTVPSTLSSAHCSHLLRASMQPYLNSRIFPFAIYYLFLEQLELNEFLAVLIVRLVLVSVHRPPGHPARPSTRLPGHPARLSTRPPG